jgi:hypothetical protein
MLITWFWHIRFSVTQVEYAPLFHDLIEQLLGEAERVKRR